MKQLRTLVAAPVLATALFAPAGLVPSAHAQIAVSSSIGMGAAGDLSAPIGRKDVRTMAGILKLSADQTTAVELLVDAFVADHTKRADAARADQEAARAAFREDRDPSIFAEMANKMTQFATATATAETQLLENIKGVLEKHQVDLWPNWERAHRRAKMLSSGGMGANLSGERVDLVQLVDRLNLKADAKAPLDPTLDAYAIAIDKALLARAEADKAAADESKSMRDSISRGGADGIDIQEVMKKADEMMKKARAASLPVKETNRQFATQIESTLRGLEPDGPALADQFATAFRVACFPDIYRERYADKALAAAAKLDSIDASQKDAILSLTQQHTRDSKIINQALEIATEEDEANFSLGGLMAGAGGGGMMRMISGSDATQAARKSRRELDAATLERLKTILGPELSKSLPERTVDSPEGGPFGGMGTLRMVAPR